MPWPLLRLGSVPAHLESVGATVAVRVAIHGRQGHADAGEPDAGVRSGVRCRAAYEEFPWPLEWQEQLSERPLPAGAATSVASPSFALDSAWTSMECDVILGRNAPQATASDLDGG